MMDLQELKRRFEELEDEAIRTLQYTAPTAADLETVKARYVGRKSFVADVLKRIGEWPPEQRGTVGKLANKFKRVVEPSLEARRRTLSEQPALEPVDVTLPGISPPVGRLHPITQTMAEIIACFVPMGFEVVEGPELEFEFYNFDALNIPPDHPSRETFDTFFIDAPSPAPRKGRLLLRSHTSPVQIRVMQARTPPLRILVPGKVFRPDPLDASHSFMFHQVEGLMVDDRTNFADLKGVLAKFVEQMFGTTTRMRFRPHFFPFTEPSAEVDIACVSCRGVKPRRGHATIRGRGCSTCGHKGWLEILGCGMVHPNVLRAVGYDPTKAQGFAFGLGVERIAMLKHGITDIRLFFENDLRFLEQF